ncbi:hypothetical protein GC098_31315 [Paenibacillus sp. LMG 31458]|uniref:Uncharacterized protein n=1 Tax=Paenibacillus phytorum TaxID=2654977 RepID=A0ABX1Y4H7_9BACL|nr:hypothetical protein [Paenibacillus phytorum]NOU75797.1 hypothetical protein [Paenibacillus phytorum]
MIYDNPPLENDRAYFINKEVVITKIVSTFHLAEVRYPSSSKTFVVDLRLLQSVEDKRNSISIKLLGGVFS